MYPWKQNTDYYFSPNVFKEVYLAEKYPKIFQCNLENRKIVKNGHEYRLHIDTRSCRVASTLSSAPASQNNNQGLIKTTVDQPPIC